MSVEVRGSAIDPKTMRAPEAGGGVTVLRNETVAALNHADAQTDMTPAPQYSESQLGFQRLLLPERKNESQPGDGMKRVGINTSILVGATAVDLAESHLVDAIWRNPMDRMVEHAREHISQDAAKTRQGVKFAGEFIEEWASDSAYTSLANAWLRMMTGVPTVTYVSETSAFIGDWVNGISQVFGGDKLYPTRFVHTSGELKGKPMQGFLGVKLAYQTMDFINPVNVEAALRLVEELPVVGKGVAWLHEKTDHLLASTIARFGNNAAAKGILGFHIGKNVKSL